jgi:hypothetical protein
MLRRQFIKIFLAGFASLLLSPRKGKTKSLALFTCMTAGFQYYDGPEIIERLLPGTLLNLRREAGNRHDNLAVAVYTKSGEKLGYIPRVLNEVPAAHLDNDGELYAVVYNANPELPSWEMLEIMVMMRVQRG